MKIVENVTYGENIIFTTNFIKNYSFLSPNFVPAVGILPKEFVPRVGFLNEKFRGTDQVTPA